MFLKKELDLIMGTPKLKMIVAIFKTDIVQEKEAQEIVEQLKINYPLSK